MADVFAVLLGVISYGLFFVTVLYAIDFVGEFIVPNPGDPRTIDPLAESLAAEALLLGLFAAQPGLMPLPGGLLAGRTRAEETAE
jgi:hypothetical protein